MGQACCSELFDDFEASAPKQTRAEKEAEYRKQVKKSNLYRKGATGYKVNYKGNPPLPKGEDKEVDTRQSTDISNPDLFRYKTNIRTKEETEQLIQKE